ncbi:MAG: PEGA domain-containing protein [Nitrospirota bacterium]
MRRVSLRPPLHALAGIMLALSSCATSINSDRQSVTIFTDPPEANVVIDDYLRVIAPGTVSLNRKSDHVAIVEKDGYEPATIKIERGMSWWVMGNVVCLIFIVNCIQKDRRDGGYYAFDDEIRVTLAKQASGDSLPPQSP